MGCGDHLGEVNEGDAVLVVQHQVKLVEVAVDQAMAGQPQDQIHQVIVGGCWVGQVVNLVPNKRARRPFK